MRGAARIRDAESYRIEQHHTTESECHPDPAQPITVAVSVTVTVTNAHRDTAAECDVNAAHGGTRNADAPDARALLRGRRCAHSGA